MKLIELYLEEIKHHLPSHNREDILKEIRSNLMDMIEDQSADAEAEPDEQLVKEILTAFGAPREVALKYGAKNVLIGPRFFPIYLQVLKIVLIVVAAVNVLGLVVTLVNQSLVGPGLLDVILELVGGLFNSLFTAFGVVTLTFAGIERTTSEKIKISMDEGWKPDDLLKQEHKERVSIAGSAFEITFAIIFIALINFFRDKIGIYYLGETGWVASSILNDHFLRYVPWLTAASILDIILALYLIRIGFWDKIANVAKVLINAFKIALFAAMIMGPAFISISPEALAGLNLDTALNFQTLTNGGNTGIDIVFGLAIFGMVVDSLKRLYENFIKGRNAQFEIDND